ncbi:hypothetical protein NL676_012126 [Syzygium grande]|nr:hypothetical protein NL676_012126 [Syzygium grande]
MVVFVLPAKRRSFSQPNHGDFMGEDVHMVALMFWLLRQQGFNISSEVFNKFKDSEGKFRESLIIDVHGLLSLYEACHLRCHGDALMEEALPFAITHLESIDETKVSTSLAKQASRALNQPLLKGLLRLEARHYISLYQEEPSHDEVLLALAKLDFNLLQEQHQKEIGKITRCCEEKNLYPTPKQLRRLEFRWDVDAMDGLLEYTQAHYKELLDLYGEIGNELATKGRSYRLVYAKEAMKKQARWYFREAKWFHIGYTPTMEEYMPLALLRTGYEALSITAFVGMGDVVTKDAFEWSLGDCKILKASQIICRFMDDIASH